MTEQTGTVTCKFPGCENPPESATASRAGRPEYCADTAHNPVTAAWRERSGSPTPSAAPPPATPRAEQPVTMARVNGAELLRQMRELAGTLAATAERLTGAVADLGDTGAAEAEVAKPPGRPPRNAPPLPNPPRPTPKPGPLPPTSPAPRPRRPPRRWRRNWRPPRPGRARRTTGWPRPPPRTPPSSSRSARKLRPDRRRSRRGAGQATPTPQCAAEPSADAERRGDAPTPRPCPPRGRPDRPRAGRAAPASRPGRGPARRRRRGPRRGRTRGDRAGPGRRRAGRSSSCAPTPSGNGTRSSPGSTTLPAAWPR